MRTTTTAYWWAARANFGDAIAPLLLNHFSDADTSWAQPEEADVIVTGSVLHLMPDSWTGTVLGAGTLYDDSEFPELATYLAVRGPLTAALVGADDVVLGDPGLLAGELVGYQERTHRIGVVPHWSDKDLGPKWHPAASLQINVADDPLTVIRQIASCTRIVTSSLHGVILADALGIPRWTEMTPQFVKEGGDHKFRDHCAAVGIPFRVGEWQSPVFSRVEDRQHELYDCFKEYGDVLRRQAWAATNSPF